MAQIFRIDLHTHSILSYDGGLSEREYELLFLRGVLDCAAITDHNEINFAKQLHKRLGKKIIVGEEIDTKEGQIIGLFLRKRIAPGKDAKETAKQIRSQGAIVYIPHPFETMRAGISVETLEQISHLVDIIEVFNSRSLQKKTGQKAAQIARGKRFDMASSSDAHGYSGMGVAYSILADMPAKETIVGLLRKALYQRQQAKILSRLTPKINKLKKMLL